MNTKTIQPGELAEKYYESIRQTLAESDLHLKLVGILTEKKGPSKTYAKYTQKGCLAAGIDFELAQVSPLQVEDAILDYKKRADIHGILVYYPVFGNHKDVELRNLVPIEKDVEGLHSFWFQKLIANERFIDKEQTKKAVLPCTPLAIIKILTELGQLDLQKEKPLASKCIAVFNRSAVVGYPLAKMLANDGARVFSVDIQGVLEMENQSSHPSNLSRQEILAQSDIVITGVPNRDFPLIQGDEIKEGALCINFSTLKNFAPSIMGKASYFVPRIGPMTIAMVMRNTLRLYQNFHAST